MNNGLAKNLNSGFNLLSSQSVGVAYWTYSVKDNVFTIDDSWFKALGLDFKTQIGHWDDLLSAEEVLLSEKTITAYFSNESSNYELLMNFSNSLGELKSIMAKATNIELDSTGQPIFVYGIHLDLTTTLKNQENKKNESLKKLAGHIAHEINNPLQVLNFSIQILFDKREETTTDSEFFLKYLTKAKDSATRITSMIKELQNKYH